MTWKDEIRSEIESLKYPGPVHIRRAFKKMRQRVRALPAGDETADRLKAAFADMKSWNRRDHVAMLRRIYIECLDKDKRRKIVGHSVARARDPQA